MKKKLVYIFLCYISLCYWPSVSAQGIPFELLLESGKRDFSNDRLESAITKFQRGLEIARGDNNYLQEAEALYWVGEWEFTQQKYSQLLHYGHEAKQLLDQHFPGDTLELYFDLLQNLGVGHGYLGRVDSQRYYYRAAVEYCDDYLVGNTEKQAHAVHNLAAIFHRTLVPDSALFWLDSTLALTETPELRATALLNKGAIYGRKNDFDRAILAQKEALNIVTDVRERILGNTHLSDYYLATDNILAARHHLQLAREIVVTENRDRGQAFSMVELQAGHLHYQLEEWDSLLIVLNRLQRFIPQNNPDYGADYMKTMHLLGSYHFAKENYKAAQAACRRGLDQGGQQRHIEHYLKLTGLLAEIYGAKGQYDRALEWVQRALHLIAPDFVPSVPGSNPHLAQIQQEALGLELFKHKIGFLLAAYAEDHKIERLQAAEEVYHLADSLLTGNRRYLRSQNSRIALARASRPFQLTAMALFHTYYDLSGDQQWVDMAFRCMERSKALLVSENLAREQALDRIIPAAERRKEEVLQDRIRELRYLLNNRKDTLTSQQERKSWQSELFLKEAAWDRLIATWENEFSAYYQLKYSLPFVSTQTVREQLLGEGEVLLNYLVEDQQVFVIGVGAEATVFHRLTLGEGQRLSHLVEDMQQALHTKSQKYYAAAHKLYQLLLEPVAEFWKNKRLVIIPDGQMWRIPFAALPIREPLVNGRAWEQPFLIQEVDLRWEYAAHAMVLQSALKDRNDRHKRYAWCGLAPFVRRSPNEGLPVLPGSAQEMERISIYFNGYASRIMEDSMATKAEFLALASQTAVLHLASHAVVNNEQPALSSLHFYSETATDAEHQVYLYELFPLSWSTELTVLTACDVNNGRLQEGEGVAGFARTFALAGCPNLVASLWPVNDGGCAVLMDDFYQGITAKKGKATALNTAQRAYLQNADRLSTHPYYWAGFILIGDDDPVYLPRSWSTWIYWCGVSVAMLLFVLTAFWYYKYR